MKKIPAILVSFLLATNAYGNVALSRILKGPWGSRHLERALRLSPEKVANLDVPRRAALYYQAKGIGFQDAFVNSPPGANVEEIGEALSLAVFIGNVPLYRELMLKLLSAPFSELNHAQQTGIFSKEVLNMMFKHPIKSVRHQFRRELYDLVNHLHKVEKPESPSPLLELPEGHISLFKIPELELEATALGKAIIENNAQKVIDAYKDLLENGSVKELLAQAYAKSSSGKGLRNFAFEHMDSNSLMSLWYAGVESNTLLTPKLRMAIEKLNYNGSSTPTVGAIFGGLLGGTAPMMMVTPSPEAAVLLGFLAFSGLIGGAVAGNFGTYKILEMIMKAR